MDFLTVEDVNSVLLEYDKVNKVDVVDCSDIHLNGEYLLDYVKVSKMGSTWSFEVINSLWTGGYFVTDGDGTVQSCTVSGGVISVSMNSAPLLHLYLSSYRDSDDFGVVKLSSLVSFDDVEVDWGENEIAFLITDLSGSPLPNQSCTVSGDGWSVSETSDENGVVSFVEASLEASEVITVTVGSDVFYLFADMVQGLASVSITGDVFVGKVNRLTVNRGNPYLEKCTITVGKTKYSIDWDSETGNILELEVDDLSPITLTVDIPPTRKIQANTETITLNPVYKKVTNRTELKTELEDPNGARYIIVRFSSASNDQYQISINHPVTLDFNWNSGRTSTSENLYIVNENTTIKNMNMPINNKRLFLQEKNTALTFEDCSFIGNSREHSIGQIVYCDSDYDSLQTDDDFVTNFVRCTFTNLNDGIYHEGELNFKDCNISMDSATSFENKSFITQIKGDCSMENTSFNMSLDNMSDYSVGENICLLTLGMGATFNGQSYDDLKSDNSLNMHGNTFRTTINRIKYDDEIDVAVERIANGNNCCHSLIGYDYIFKNNTRIRRLD